MIPKLKIGVSEKFHWINFREKNFREKGQNSRKFLRLKYLLGWAQSWRNRLKKKEKVTTKKLTTISDTWKHFFRILTEYEK